MPVQGPPYGVHFYARTIQYVRNIVGAFVLVHIV